MLRRLVGCALALGFFVLSGSALARNNKAESYSDANVTITDGHSISSDGAGVYVYGEGSKSYIADDPPEYDWFSFYTYYPYSTRFFRLNIAGTPVQGDCGGNYDGVFVKSTSTPQWFPGWTPVQGHATVACTISGVLYKVSFGSDTAECVAIAPADADTWRFTADCVGNVSVAKAIGKKGNTRYETISSGHSATFDLSADTW